MNPREELGPGMKTWLNNREENAGSVADEAGALDTLYAAGPDSARTTRAIRELKASLSKAAGPEILYGGFSHPDLGPVFVAFGPRGVVAVNFGVSEKVFLAEMRRQTGAEPRRSDQAAANASGQIGDYLAGRRMRFNLPLDLDALTPFQRDVLRETAAVPPGEVATYAEIARRIGRPKAYRAVGNALGRNPVPILIPCHRVIATDGSLGGYSGGGGLKTKAHLLALEGAAV